MRALKRYARRPAQVAGLLGVVEVRRRLDEVADEVDEARRHEVVLEREVSRIEASVGRIARTWAAAREESHH